MKIEVALAGVQYLYFDSAPFIYFIESYPAYIKNMRVVMGKIARGNIIGVTSTITLTEILTKPIKDQDTKLEIIYRKFLLNTRNLQVVDVNKAIAEQAAHLRAQYRLKTPDALQIATALDAHCDAFLTNDKGLVSVQNIKILLVDDLTP